jgi:hypothetical protein
VQWLGLRIEIAVSDSEFSFDFRKMLSPDDRAWGFAAFMLEPVHDLCSIGQILGQKSFAASIPHINFVRD